MAPVATDRNNTALEGQKKNTLYEVSRLFYSLEVTVEVVVKMLMMDSN